MQTVPENQFPAHAIHEGLDALERAASLLGDPLADPDENRAKFWTGLFELISPAGNA